MALLAEARHRPLSKVGEDYRIGRKGQRRRLGRQVVLECIELAVGREQSPARDASAKPDADRQLFRIVKVRMHREDRPRFDVQSGSFY